MKSDHLGKQTSIMSLETAINSHPNPLARAIIEQHLETDPLTEVLNRRGFQKRLHRAKNRADRNQITFSYAFVDLYQLSAYNEISHEKGDEAIIAMADLLKNSLREEDAIGREGEKSDEFSLIISGLEKKDHENYLRRMKFEVQQSPRIVEEIPFLAYWGVAEYIGQSLEELKYEADQKLIREKKIIKKILGAK